MTRLYRTCGNEANIQAPQVVAPIVKRSPSFKTRTPSGGGSTSSSGTAPMPTITDENGVSSSAFRRGDLVEVLQVDEDEVKVKEEEEDKKTEKSKEAEEDVPSEPLGLKAASSEGGDDKGSGDPSSPKEPPPPSKVEVAEAEPTQVKKEEPKEPKEEVWLKARIVRVFAGGVTVRYMDKDEMEEVFDLSRVSSLSTNSHNTAPTQEADVCSGLSVATKDDQEGEEEDEEEEEGKEPELAPDPNLPDWLQSGPIEPPKPKPKAEKKATATKTISDVKFGDEYEVTFSAGRMGFRLQQDPRSGAAMVVHVVPYEAASCAGVKVGDVVVGMEGHYVPHYETIMSWLSSVRERERGAYCLLHYYCTQSF
jgi:hypothetical protein